MNSEKVIIDIFNELDFDSKIKVQNIINTIIAKEKPKENTSFECTIKESDLYSICWF
jgi:hypothetical protein